MPSFLAGTVHPPRWPPPRPTTNAPAAARARRAPGGRAQWRVPCPLDDSPTQPHPPSLACAQQGQRA
eukprot:6962170-Prymnesium_polylepis.1